MEQWRMEMSVGQIAKRAGISVATLHFYEQKGLIYSVRSQGNQRRYNRHVLRRIAVIKAAQNVGLSLKEIARALADLPKNRAPNKAEWEKMANLWQAQLDEKIRNLQALQAQLGACICCGCLSLKSCALYNPDDHCGVKHAGAKLIAEK
jgi:MerR family redox-sensitive transcriptional activator SoxR